VCGYCEKTGHFASECRKRIADEGARQGNEKRANVANTNERNDGEATFSCVSTGCLRASEPNAFYLDSGCTEHMSDQRHLFTNFQNISPNTKPIDGIGGTKLYAHGFGDIKVTRLSGGIRSTGWLMNVLYVPNLTINLVSVGCVTESGLNVVFQDTSVKIMKNNNIVMTGSRIGKTLYRLDISTDVAITGCFTANSNLTDLDRWHERLAHVNMNVVKKMATSTNVIGITLNEKNTKGRTVCHGCNLGKMHKLPFNQSAFKSRRIGELIHSDVVGPMQTASPKGARYYIVFKDDYSRYKVVYFLKNKSEAAETFILFNKKLFCETGKKVDTLRSDNGGEFSGKEFVDWLMCNGIKQQTSAPYTPEQNGKAERDHRTTVESARSMIHHNEIPVYLWAEAVNHAVYVLNRCLTANTTITPFEIWHKRKPDLTNLRIFGSVTYVLTPESDRQKLDPKAQKGIYVGESESQKASRVYFKSSGKIIISRHIKVYEDSTNNGDGDVNREESQDCDKNEVRVAPDVGGTSAIKRKSVPFVEPIRQSKRGHIPKKLHQMETYLGMYSILQKNPNAIFISLNI
jgi:transposase InsO family protein